MLGDAKQPLRGLSTYDICLFRRRLFVRLAPEQILSGEHALPAEGAKRVLTALVSASLPRRRMRDEKPKKTYE